MNVLIIYLLGREKDREIVLNVFRENPEPSNLTSTRDDVWSGNQHNGPVDRNARQGIGAAYSTHYSCLDLKSFTLRCNRDVFIY